MLDRREFVKQSLLLSGTAALSSVLSLPIKQAFAIDPEEGSTYLDAEHIVILMQENRSFDHVFGSLKGVRGFNDPRAIVLPNGNPVWLQENSAAETYFPFRLDIRNTNATWTGMLPHTRSSQIDAFNDGKFDKWLDSKKSTNPLYADMPLTLGYYTREDVPFYYAMADAFTICDQHFCSVMTGTYPNRSMLWTGKIRENNTTKAYLRNSDYRYAEIDWPTFPEKLEENGVSWGIYQNDIYCGDGLSREERAWLTNLGCNPMEYFTNYNVKFSSRYIATLKTLIQTLPAEIQELEQKLSELPSAGNLDKLREDLDKKLERLISVRREIKVWTKENFERLPKYKQKLFERAFLTNAEEADFLNLKELKYTGQEGEHTIRIPKGDILHQFRKDVNAGKLPTVSWLVAPENFSDHPNAPWYGAWYVSEVLDILTKKPEVWKKTIFILTYDENDGYFDHVPPFIPPDLKIQNTGKCSPGIRTDQEFSKREDELKEGVKSGDARSGPAGLGYRVPMIIASPWSRGGRVCSQVFDHTSSLQFLENFLSHKLGHPVREHNISQWHRTVCGDLTSAFTVFNKSESHIGFLKKDTHMESILSAKFKSKPAGFRKLTKAEVVQAKQPNTSAMFLPKQEPGIKPACSLPYELYADGKPGDNKKHFEITMKAGNHVFRDRSAGSPFKIYASNLLINDKNKETVRVRDYAVKAGEYLTDSWPINLFENNNYRLRLYGPNGFYREFRGNDLSPDLDISFGKDNRPTLNIVSLNVYKEYKVNIHYHGYENSVVIRKTIAAGQREGIELEINTRQSHGWYDFSVIVDGDEQYQVRYAGHLENGKISFTDPVMGRLVEL